MRHGTIRSLTLACAGALALAGAAAAQPSPDAAADKAEQQRIDRRFQDLERQVHRLQSIITQARDTGQPVQVRVDTDPDPVLDGLQTRLDDMEQAARTRNDQIDTLTHDLEMARKDAADARAQVRALNDRIDRLEAEIKAVSASAAAAPPPPAADQAGSLGPAPSQGGPPPPQAAAPQDPAAAFRAAKQLLLDGEYARAGAAFQDFVDAYGDSPNGPEARYWLGETLFIRGVYADAATAYIGAIRGWPQTSWAPDAVVKLARSLVALGKAPDACRTLDEFARRYPAASAPVRAKADATRNAAKCAAA